jgi:toxin ParE1/3/4
VTAPVRFELEATLEMIEAADWYETRERGLGTEFLNAIEKTLDIVRRWPDAAPKEASLPDSLNCRHVQVPRFPYRIVYIVTPHSIRVLAVAHTSRRPAYWARRD